MQRASEIDCCFFSSRRRHTRLQGDWSSDVCSSDLQTLDYSGQRVDLLFSAPDGPQSGFEALLLWQPKRLGRKAIPRMVGTLIENRRITGELFESVNALVEIISRCIEWIRPRQRTTNIWNFLQLRQTSVGTIYRRTERLNDRV